MKKVLILLFTFLLSISANSDCYTGYYIKFLLETYEGEINTGYIPVSSCSIDVDSLKNAEYTKTKLIEWSQHRFWGQQLEESVFWYFQDMLKFEYEIWEDTEQKHTVCKWTNEKSIPIEEIKTIKTDSIITQSLFLSISNDLQLKDTVWIKEGPIKRIEIGAYLCTHNIFFYQDIEDVNRLVKEIEFKQKELDGIEINGENGDEIDLEIWKIIEKLNGLKVVIVSECFD